MIRFTFHILRTNGRASHEQDPLIPSFSASGGEGAGGAFEGDCDQFMAPMHARERMEASHEPSFRSGVSAERRWLVSERMAALCRDAATPKFMVPMRVQSCSSRIGA